MEPAVATPEFDKGLAFPEGEAWPGMYNCSVREIPSNTPPSSPLDHAYIQFSLQTPGSAPSATIAASITSAANWEFEFPKQNIAGLTQNLYRYVVHLIAQDGSSQTYAIGAQAVGARLFTPPP